MAFKKLLTQRIFNISKVTNPALTNCRISSPSTAVTTAAAAAPFNHQETTKKIAHDPGDDGVFRRYFHRHAAAVALPELRFFPTGDKLLEKIRGMDIVKGRNRLAELMPPVDTVEASPEGKVTVADAKKILLLSQLEMVKSRLRQIEKGCVSYSEFLQICVNECSSTDQGVKFAKLLDQSGAVIVLGNSVFLRPEQVMKAIQGLIPLPSAHNPNDPRMKELQEMEKEKAAIDKKAGLQVRRELWCGLGYLVVQTAAFMRLTFWELTWDVMEPICFYVTSMYFMGGYAFFLRTSKEPSFEGFFQSRFDSKQRRLMELQNFDIERYNELKKACSNSLAPRESAVSCTSILHHDP